MHEHAVSAGPSGWLRRWRARVDVDPQLPALLRRITDQVGGYLDRGGLDAPTWVSEMGALERQLTELTAGTRDRLLHGLLRDLLRQISAVYASAPGIACQPRPSSTAALFDALEAAEALGRRAQLRAAELQASTPLRQAVA